MSHQFESFSLQPYLLTKLKEAGITEPTSVQQKAIPVLMEGKDAIVESQTGTGKTLAYVLPLLNQIDPREKKLQALILAPTRELGIQIAEVLAQLTAGTEITAQSLIGGAAIGRQIERLRLHPQIVVGTPGRVHELIMMKKLSMHYVRSIVVDEADQVLELGASMEMEGVLRSAMRDRQLCFFSATMPTAVLGLAERWMRDPVRIQSEPGQKAAETLEHFYVVCEERSRIDMLKRLVWAVKPQSGIVFISEVEMIGEVLAKLRFAGLTVEALYSEAGKQERAKVMKDFREGRVELLLATDVAARGLDIPEVTHVFHFDLPVDADHYVHRSGRTGRMGRRGTVISLCTPRQTFIMEKYEKALGISIRPMVLYEGKLQTPEAAAKRSGGRVKAQPAALTSRGSPNETRSKQSLSAPASKKPVSEAAVKMGKPARAEDKKNKGAPRWLKAKQNGDADKS